MHHTVQNILNVTSSLLMLLFDQPSSGNSLINCQALYNLQSYRLWSKFCILYWMVPCWQAVWGVTFKMCVIFRCPVWKIEKLTKANLHENWSTQTLFWNILNVLPNFIKIDPYNFELYRFKLGAFFLRHSVVCVKFDKYIANVCRSLRCMSQATVYVATDVR